MVIFLAIKFSSTVARCQAIFFSPIDSFLSRRRVEVIQMQIFFVVLH